MSKMLIVHVMHAYGRHRRRRLFKCFYVSYFAFIAAQSSTLALKNLIIMSNMVLNQSDAIM